MKKIFILIFLFYGSHAFTQELLHGKVVSVLLYPVADARVLNKNNASVVLSKQNGDFNIFASTGDTLVVTCIGFVKTPAIVRDTSLILIPMQPDTVFLDTVTVTAFPNYDELKRQLAEMHSDTAQQVLKNNLMVHIDLPPEKYPNWVVYQESIEIAPGVSAKLIGVKKRFSPERIYNGIKRITRDKRPGRNPEVPGWKNK